MIVASWRDCKQMPHTRATHIGAHLQVRGREVLCKARDFFLIQCTRVEHVGLLGLALHSK